MTAERDPFAEFDRTRAIELRWTMRDILAKRWMLAPIDPDRLDTLIRIGLVEMRDDEPVLTNTGLDVLRR
jgi:hypothetical protein